MKLVIIISIFFILILVLVMMFLGTKNKFLLLNIKLDEAYSNIELFLQKKAVSLNKIIKQIKAQIDEDDFSDFVEIVDNEKDSFKLHSLLSKYYAKVSKILFDNENLAKDEEIIKYLTELKSNEEDLIGSIKFHNDTVVDYNGLLKNFPYKIFSKFLGYSEKEFYNNEKEELFEILKETEK